MQIFYVEDGHLKVAEMDHEPESVFYSADPIEALAIHIKAEREKLAGRHHTLIETACREDFPGHLHEPEVLSRIGEYLARR